MSLARLIYKSVANEKATLNQGLKVLEEQASSNNSSNGITGLLMLIGDSFVQVLEGEPKALTTLFGKIAADKRHSDVELVSFESINRRSFDQWAMRLVDIYDLAGDKRTYLLSKYAVENDNIIIPEDLYQLHSLLFDARELCLSTPWKGE